MKAFVVLLASIQLLVSAETVTWTTFTGWDHGYTLTVDGEEGSIALAKRLGQGKLGPPQVQKFPGSMAFVTYVKTLVEMVPGGEIGPQADDGRVIKVTVKSGGGIPTKEINEIELYTDPRYFGSIEDPKGNKLLGETFEKGVKDDVAQIKRWVEAYMLQQMMFYLKVWYFGGAERIAEPKQGE